MFESIDIVTEIIKYLPFRDVLNLQKTCGLYYHMLNTIIYAIKEDQFLEDNNVKVINKTFQLHIKDKLDFSKIVKLSNFGYCYKKKWKHAKIRYISDNVRITIDVNNLLIISGCKTYIMAHNKIKEISQLFHDNEIGILETDKLKEISTVVRYNKLIEYSKVTGWGYGFMANINLAKTEHHHYWNRLTYDKNLIYYIHQNGTVEVRYNNFKRFYLSYNWINGETIDHKIAILYHFMNYISGSPSYHILTYGSVVDNDVTIIIPFQNIPFPNKRYLPNNKKYIGIEYERLESSQSYGTHAFGLTEYRVNRDFYGIRTTPVPDNVKQMWEDKYPNIKAKHYGFVHDVHDIDYIHDYGYSFP